MPIRYLIYASLSLCLLTAAMTAATSVSGAAPGVHKPVSIANPDPTPPRLLRGGMAKSLGFQATSNLKADQRAPIDLMGKADTAFGVISRHRLEAGRCYDAFRVTDPIQVLGITIRGNRLLYADDRGPIGVLDVSMEPSF